MVQVIEAPGASVVSGHVTVPVSESVTTIVVRVVVPSFETVIT